MPGPADEGLVAEAFGFEGVFARELDEARHVRVLAALPRFFVELDEEVQVLGEALGGGAERARVVLRGYAVLACWEAR